MRHSKAHRKFGRKSNVRKAFIQSLMVALIENEQITTTVARAKSLRPAIEKLVTKARTGELADRRFVASKLGNHQVATKKLVDDIAPRFKDQPGGYVRIVKMPQRGGDAAHMAIISFVK